MVCLVHVTVQMPRLGGVAPVQTLMRDSALWPGKEGGTAGKRTFPSLQGRVFLWAQRRADSLSRLCEEMLRLYGHHESSEHPLNESR